NPWTRAACRRVPERVVTTGSTDGRTLVGFDVDEGADELPDTDGHLEAVRQQPGQTSRGPPSSREQARISKQCLGMRQLLRERIQSDTGRREQKAALDGRRGPYRGEHGS